MKDKKKKLAEELTSVLKETKETQQLMLLHDQ